MTADIIITQKPDAISWEELAKCQQRAHDINKSVGVNMKCASYSADELRAKASQGITLVALDISGRLAGMLTIVYRNINNLWHKGMAAEICYVAVAPEFQGRGVYKQLGSKAIDLIKSRGVKVAYLTTHINNKNAQRAYEKDGYIKVMLTPGAGLDYYSILMAKWLEKDKRHRLVCAFLYIASAVIVKLLYKPGKQSRL